MILKDYFDIYQEITEQLKLYREFIKFLQANKNIPLSNRVLFMWVYMYVANNKMLMLLNVNYRNLNSCVRASQRDYVELTSTAANMWYS